MITIGGSVFLGFGRGSLFFLQFLHFLFFFSAAGFRVEAVGVLAPFFQLLAGCRQVALLRRRSLLQPGGLGGLGFGLGLRRTRLGRGFVGERFAALELGRLQPGLLADFFRLLCAP